MTEDRDPIVFQGVVRRVTFEREEGFRVVRVEGEKGEIETVVGVMPPLAKGMVVRVVGRRVVDPKFGSQVQAESATVVTPSTRGGVERFLGSGIVKGLRKRLAARIVEHFGDGVLRVLDEGGAELREVRGIGAKKAAAIAKAWADHQKTSAALVFLQGHGVSPSLAMRIFKRYGARTEEIVQRSPYRLATEIAGVGFATADGIARSLGIAKDAPERLDAGVVHALGLFVDAGHTRVARRDLVERAARELGADGRDVDAAVERVAATGAIVVQGGGSSALVASKVLRDAEEDVARALARLAKDPAKPLPGAREAIADFERAAGVALAPAQRLAVESAAVRRALVLTGGPGVGKTTVVRALLALFSRAKLRVRLAAPTGRAAKRLAESTGHPASTLHRLLEVDPRTGGFAKNRHHPLDLDVLVVDEASMIDVLLARALFDAVPPSSRVVLVGDVDQLPSVGPGAFLRDVISSGVVPTVRLTTIFRQAAESLIVAGAHRILDGLPPESAKSPTGDLFVIPRTDPAEARATILELVQRRIPERFGLDPIRDVQVLTPMRRGEVGANVLNDELQMALNPGPRAEVRRQGRTLRLGDKLMQQRNDYVRDVYNGDVGTIVAIDAEARQITVRIDDRDVVYDEDALDALSLGYALSIHKSQGSEYPAVVVPWLRQHYVMLSRNLLYTAVTRGKKLVVLVADPRAIDIALAEDRREDRSTSLAERLRAASEELARRA